MRIFKYILLVALLYIYFYNPIFQILSFGLIKIILIISFLYIAISGFLPRFLKIFKKEIILTSILIFYSLLITVFGDNSLIIPYIHLIWFLECFLIPTFIFLVFKDFFNSLSFEAIVVQVGFFAALITFFLFLNPETNFFIRNSVIMESLDNRNGDTYFRGFTLAENSTYGYGIVQGLVLSICLFSMHKNKKYLLPIFFLFVSIIFNARIGLAPVLISLFIMIIYKHIKIRNLAIISSMMIFLYWFLQNSSFAEQNEASLKWSLDFFSDTQDFVTGKDYSPSSNYQYLFSGSMIFFPPDFLGLIFGTGENILFSRVHHSDIGYVNQIYYGGITYLLIMFVFLWKMFKRNYYNTASKLLAIVFFLVLPVANYKGIAFFVPSGFFRLITLFYVFSIFRTKGIIGGIFIQNRKKLLK